MKVFEVKYSKGGSTRSLIIVAPTPAKAVEAWGKYAKRNLYFYSGEGFTAINVIHDSAVLSR